MEDLSKTYSGKVDVFKINTEQEQELASVFAVRSIPSVLFVPVGAQPQMAVGALPKEGYMEAIDKVFGIKPPIIVE
jgi:thioredoxin-like negative regulator of GroEL